MHDCQQWGREERKDEAEAAERGSMVAMPTFRADAKRMLEGFVYVLRARDVTAIVAVVDAFANPLSV